MCPADKACIKYAMKNSNCILTDTDDGPVYWDFDFKKKEFRAGSVCNTGLIPVVVQKYRPEPSVFEMRTGDITIGSSTQNIEVRFRKRQKGE